MSQFGGNQHNAYGKPAPSLAPVGLPTITSPVMPKEKLQILDLNPGMTPLKEKSPEVSQGLPPWLYQVDGVWYSDYDPSAPPRPDGNAKATLKTSQDPVIPTAPSPSGLGLIQQRAPRIVPREDNRTSSRRFRTSGLGTIGGV